MMGDLTVKFTIKIAPSVPADIGLSLDPERRETLILGRNVADIRSRGTTSTKCILRASREPRWDHRHFPFVDSGFVKLKTENSRSYGNFENDAPQLQLHL